MAVVVNSMLEKSEQQVERGIRTGSDTKKVLPQGSVYTRNSGNQNARRPMYIYSSNWNVNDRGEGTVRVSLYETDASRLGM